MWHPSIIPANKQEIAHRVDQRLYFSLFNRIWTKNRANDIKSIIMSLRMFCHVIDFISSLCLSVSFVISFSLKMMLIPFNLCVFTLGVAFYHIQLPFGDL